MAPQVMKPRYNGKSPFHPIRSYKATYDGGLRWMKGRYTWRLRTAIMRFCFRRKVPCGGWLDRRY